MKKQTLRFYTDTNRYMGWVYLNQNTYHNKVINWIRSGNYVMINDYRINWINKNMFILNSHLNNLIKKEK